MYRKITTTIITLLLFSIMLVPVTNASTLDKTVEGMLGFAPPEGTTASASSEYTPQYSADKSIDQNKESYWNAGTYTGSIELKFPNPTEFNFIHITTNAKPVRTVSYIIYGLKNGEWIKISEEVTQSLKDTFTTSPPIKVKEGAYEAIKIDGNGGSSWLAISEITLGTFELINLAGEPQDSSARLNWNSIKEATGYKIQYGTEPGKYTDSMLVNENAKDNYIVPNLTNGSTYYFQIVAIFNGVETVISNEAVVTLPGKNEPSQPPVPSSNRAILVVIMTTGLEKEFDLSMQEVNDFINWYEAKQEVIGKSSYAIDKRDNNKGPFKSRKDYILYDSVLTFEVSEY